MVKFNQFKRLTKRTHLDVEFEGKFYILISTPHSQLIQYLKKKKKNSLLPDSLLVMTYKNINLAMMNFIHFSLYCLLKWTPGLHYIMTDLR